MSELHPGAIVCLAPGVALGQGMLKDFDGTSYPLNHAGLLICELIEEPLRVEDILEIVSLGAGVSIAEARPNVEDYLCDLNERGLVSVQQSFTLDSISRLTEVPYQVVEFFMLRHIPRRRAPLSRRYSPTIANVLRGCIEANQAITWVGVVFLSLAVAIVFLTPTVWSGGAADVLPVLFIGSSIFLLVLGFTAVHELAHLFAAKFRSSRIYGVYVRAGAMGLGFATPNQRSRALIAAAGPIGGAAFLAAAAVLTLHPLGSDWAHPPNDPALFSIFAVEVVLLLAQLACLTPISKDGRQIRVALREIRSKRRTEGGVR